MEIATANETRATKSSFFLVIVTYLAFISLGLPDGLLGIAWPFMSTRANVALDSLGVLLLGFTVGYLSTSSTSGKILKFVSLGMLLAISCVLTALSLLIYALSDAWYVMIVASFFLGAGGGAIDSSINTFAASRFSASTVNWLHAFYGVGATTGPLLITLMLTNRLAWYHGYIAVAAIQISLAVLFFFTQKRWQVSSASSAHDEQHSNAAYLHTLKLPVVWLYMLIFFLYTGLEQGFGQWLFTLLTKSRGIAEEQAGLWAGLYWGSLTVGRIIFGIALTRIPVKHVLTGAMAGIVGGVVLFTININTLTTLAGISILGIANAPVFPSLISVTPERIGKEHTATAIGVQISMAMLGGALLPGSAGLLSEEFGLEVIAKVFTIAAIVLALAYLLGANGSKRISRVN
ncbi:MFS transporter [Chryseosolibacter indicus]|uniref:MFS transporter n=1 Tax=Chryseosolibacter indicus TaxID=2782351 RepID=A0ABS5VU18_9BACT|nr:MFS transporter [Chryseosolibacter indicus]MBT1704919.1 MFS transporter [Chryseosolibacter indicus]